MRVIIVFIVGLITIAAISAQSTPRISERIVGGAVTSIEDYPFSASLLSSNNLVNYWQYCGGSILTTRAILTAGHCFSQTGLSTDRWRIRVGSTWANSGGIVHNTGTIILHPEYNNWNLDNDIAVMHTATLITYVPNVVSNVAIAGPNYILPDNQPVWAIGWGRTAHNGELSEQLRHVQIWTISQATCRNRYSELGWAITDNMLCSGWLDIGGRDQCQGDSGSPLLHDNVVVGVCSFGYECARARHPGVNTRVSRFTGWIQANA